MTSTEIDRTLASLADPTRRRVVDLLRRRPLRAGELAAKLKTSAPAMSRHLRVLRQGGIIEIEGEAGIEDDARVRVYRLRPERFAAMRGWLDEVEGYWSDQLAAFKEHAERRKRERLEGATTTTTSTAKASGAARATAKRRMR